MLLTPPLSLSLSLYIHAAIRPEVSVLDNVDRDPLTVDRRDDKNNLYEVEVGHDFQVTCVSTGNFSGEVTWYRMSSGGTVGELVFDSLSCLYCTCCCVYPRTLVIIALPAGTKVVEVNETTSEEIMIGSGDGAGLLSPSPTSPPPIIQEEPGQLYAYRLSRSEVSLGTRRRNVLGASIGVQPLAMGTYICVAQNTFMNAFINNTVTMTVQVKGI